MMFSVAKTVNKLTAEKKKKKFLMMLGCSGSVEENQFSSTAAFSDTSQTNPHPIQTRSLNIGLSGTVECAASSNRASQI